MAGNSLTSKEIEVLALIAQGHDAKSAARELSISSHTIYERLRRARAKLGVNSSREAARIFFKPENNQNLVNEKFVLADPDQSTALTGLSGVATAAKHPTRELDRSPKHLSGSLWSTVLESLPLRTLDESQVHLTKAERLQIIANLSAKLSVTFVAICFAAMIANTLFSRG
jgi:DNA-binding CsgD family transcriptional regulator